MSSSIPEGFAEVLRPPRVETQVFGDDGTFPNNQALPVVILRQAVQPTEVPRADRLERVFRAHGWQGQWRNGIFSTAHEVIGVAAGTARVQFGGPEGTAFDVNVGDVLVLPAGVAHKNLSAASDFLVVGAYPDGQEWDLRRGRSGERPDADRNIEQVPLPSADPLYGPNGPLAVD